MNQEELLKIVAPMWKQYLRTLVLCLSLFVCFEINNSFFMFVSLLICLASLGSMLESTKWQIRIRKGDYDIEYARIDSFIFGRAIINDSSDIGLCFIKGLKQGDKVMIVLIDNDYLIVKKVK